MKPMVSLVPTGYWYKNLLPDYKLHTTVLEILTIEKTHGILILSRVLSHHNNIFICLLLLILAK